MRVLSNKRMKEVRKGIRKAITHIHVIVFPLRLPRYLLPHKQDHLQYLPLQPSGLAFLVLAYTIDATAITVSPAPDTSATLRICEGISFASVLSC